MSTARADAGRTPAIARADETRPAREPLAEPGPAPSAGPWPRRLAITTAGATWLLLLVGCMVHGTGSSLACPDWPTCFGSFTPKMEGGVFYEHSHRLVATAIGCLTLALAAVLFRARKVDERARGTAKLGFAAVGLVIWQGVLGGITVLLKLPTLVTLAHLTTSMCFFSLLTYIALRTSPRVQQKDAAAPQALSPMRPLVLGVALATLAQIILGGVTRHTNNGLACHTVPLCDGGVLWPDRVGERIHMGHRFFGVALAVMVIALAVAIWRRSRASSPHRRLAGLAVVLVVTQIVLGLLSVTGGLPLFTVTAHLGVAALILVTHVAMFVLIPARALGVTIAGAPPVLAARDGDHPHGADAAYAGGE